MENKKYRLVVKLMFGRELHFHYDTRLELTVAERLIQAGLEDVIAVTPQQWIDESDIRFCGEERYMNINL